MPLRVTKVRKSKGGPEGVADERARNPGSPAGEERQRTKSLVPEVGPGGTDCTLELLAQDKHEPDLPVIQNDESHAMSRCEQPKRGSTHHSNREVAFCVGGTRATTDDAKQCHRGSS